MTRIRRSLAITTLKASMVWAAMTRLWLAMAMTHQFEQGFGQDIVSDAGWSNQAGNDDKIVFGAGFVLEDLRARVDGEDLLLSFVGSEDSIRIDRTLTESTYRIESVEFEDGRTLSHVELMALAHTATDGDQELIGSDAAEAEGADTITGGTGNDFLSGRSQNDVYRFEVGFGQDIVSDDGWSNQAGTDEIAFGPGLELEDLRVEIIDNDLMLTFVGRDDSILVVDTIDESTFRIESVSFDDGRSLSHVELMALANVTTAEDQDMRSGPEAEELNGGAGSDTLTGFDGNDTLIGGTGNDFLSGRSQNDTYHFEAGFGQDIVSDNGWSSQAGTDVITFGAGISLDDLEVRASGEDIVLTFVGSDDRILMEKVLTTNTYVIESIVFEDGRSLTHAELVALTQTGTAGNDALNGTAAADALNGLAGDDTINGLNGNDTLDGGDGFDSILGGSNDDVLTGGAGNDTLNGGDQADTLTGGTGDDLLIGGQRNDVYVFGTGFGRDIIDEDDGWSARSGTDRVEMAAASTDVSIYTQGDDIIIAVNGTSDQLRMIGTINGGNKRVESVQFDGDGITLSHADLLAVAQPYPGPSGVNVQGNAATNLLVGTAGDDEITGLITGSEMRGNAGNDTLTGGDDAETLDGGTGNDSLSGMGGDDTYRFSAGFGQDVINDGGDNAAGNFDVS